MHLHRLPLLILFGATVGAALDYLHTDGGAIVYPDGTNHWRGVLTFALAYGPGGVVYVAVFHRMFAKTAAPRRPLPYPQTWSSVVVFSLLYALTAYAGEHLHSYTLCAVLLAASFYYWRKFDRSWQGVVCGAVTGFLGGGFESVLSHHGTMQYATQDVYMIPVWLPALYCLWSTCWGQQVCGRALLVADHLSTAVDADSCTGRLLRRCSSLGALSALPAVSSPRRASCSPHRTSCSPHRRTVSISM
jgi:hypothetical protein